MTLQLIRNKIEQALLEQFAAVESALPGTAAVRQLRKDAIGAFAAAGLPHRRIEEWKYTDLRNLLKDAPPPAGLSAATALKAADLNAALGALSGHESHRIVFVDGRFDRALSSVKTFDKRMHFVPLAQALTEDPDWLLAHIAADTARGAVPALNTAFMTDGVTLRIGDDAAVEKPILIVYARTSPVPQATAVRNYIKFGHGCRATVLEAHIVVPGASESGQTNALATIDAGDRAEVTYVMLTAQRAASTHLATLSAKLGKETRFRPFQMACGTGLVRNDIAITYAGEGAALDLSGLLLGRGHDHIDTTLVVDHAVPGCQSRELFKVVLDDRAHAIFQGKIIVQPHAQKTDGKQMAQALMLSPETEFSSKPELEIYADDVVCGHGSTAADLDEDLVFYLRARGIPTKEARALLIQSFIGEALEKVEHPALRAALADKALIWLNSGKVA